MKSDQPLEERGGKPLALTFGRSAFTLALIPAVVPDFQNSCVASRHLDDRIGCRWLSLATSLALLLWLLCLPVLSQTIPATNTVAELSRQIESRLTEAKDELARFVASRAGTTNLAPGATPAEQIEFQLQEEALVRVYQQHLEDLGRLESSRQRYKEEDLAAKAWTGFAEPAPYSILMVDGLRDSVQSLGASVTSLETSRGVLLRLDAEDQAITQASDERLRLIAEQLETESDPVKIARLSWQRSLEGIKNRSSLARRALQETRRQRVELDLASNRQQLALMRRQLALADASVQFTKADLDKVLGQLDNSRHDLETELKGIEAENQRRQTALSEAREAVRNALQEKSAAAPGQQPADLSSLQRKVEVCAVEAETASQSLAALRQMLDLAILERGMWELRYETFGTTRLAELRMAYKRLEHLLDLAQAAKPHFLRLAEAVRLMLEQQRRRIESSESPSLEAAQAAALVASYREREAVSRRVLSAVERVERLAQRWKESLDKNRSALPIQSRVRDLFSEFSSLGSKLWTFELYAVQDTIVVDGQSITGRRAITLGKIVMAILILGFGYWLSVILSGLIESVAVRKLKVEANQANLIRRWARVVVIIALILFSLVSVKIPLTAFAFLGGALAIGLGFGTQNLLKNFISGIIILFERPFRVGDVLDINGKRGKVNSIGIRSSVLELWDGTETLIPNSSLLENDLTNWTYTNRTVRFSVTVGVAYGSDTRKVADLLAEIADRHGLVLKNPTPMVLFQDFADSALTFELRYHVDVLKNNAALVASDLRHMIAVSFAETGINIAFPQRDLHLSTLSPLAVQLAPSGSLSAQAAGPPPGERPHQTTPP